MITPPKPADSHPTDSRRAKFFDDDVAWDWVDLSGTHRTQLLEVENDLIASHVETLGQPPVAQFLG